VVSSWCTRLMRAFDGYVLYEGMMNRAAVVSEWCPADFSLDSQRIAAGFLKHRGITHGLSRLALYTKF
jgi:hypothetical protein